MTPPEPKYVFGIDQAKVSGWAIAEVRGKAIASGIAKNHAERNAALSDSRFLQRGAFGAHYADVLVVFEDHSDFRMAYGSNRKANGQHQKPIRTQASLLSLGAARGRWEELLDMYQHPERLRLSVTPKDWRARVLSSRQSVGTEELKERAKRWASAHVGRWIADDNEADAICIAAWGALDGLGVLMAERVQRRTKARIKRELAKQKPLAFE